LRTTGQPTAFVVYVRDAVSGKPSSNKPSLISQWNGIAILGLVGTGGRRGNDVVVPPFVTNQLKSRDPIRTRDQRRLMA
jgi:hypothetical protein